MVENRLPHLVINNQPTTHNFTSTQRGGPSSPDYPSLDPEQHGYRLIEQLNNVVHEIESTYSEYEVNRQGYYLEFKGRPGEVLTTQSLEDINKNIRLLNVRCSREQVEPDMVEDQSSLDTIYATVFTPRERVDHYTNKIEKYINVKTKKGRPWNERLVSSIDSIESALRIDAFWTDQGASPPKADPVWCEIWLRDFSAVVSEQFAHAIESVGAELRNGQLNFPERIVFIVRINEQQLIELIRICDFIAEIRLAKETSAFWIELPTREQAEWVEELLSRVELLVNNVSICLIDTGVNYGHPLLTQHIREDDCSSVNDEWLTDDHAGHGTLMAGLALYGNLSDQLESKSNVVVTHCLESVKILPRNGTNDSALWGYLTSQAISIAEIQAPFRQRVHCMAITCTDTRDQGRPSSWSSEIDQTTSGTNDGIRRLMLLAGGNIIDQNNAWDYPNLQKNSSIHDPAQAWNAVTVGAFTNLGDLTDSNLQGYRPLVSPGGLSPFSCTSTKWNESWPIKPEILMEGGNLAYNGSSETLTCEDLSLVSTYYRPQDHLLFPFLMTSAATALAARFAAEIQAKYPNYWPETIRALMIHSAQWTRELCRRFGGDGSKRQLRNLLKVAGYGIPEKAKALYSASNYLTLIAQAELQPFEKVRKRDDNDRLRTSYTTKDMHLYELPWPKDALLGMPVDAEVELRITLSYFVEPGPGVIGESTRYRYASHGLRFDLNSPGESQYEFIQRINRAERSSPDDHPGTESTARHWKIGAINRNRGSIHSDIWQGTAAELAQSNIVAIYPTIGWWRERHKLEKWNDKTRYALIVSISTPDTNVDLYTPVKTMIDISPDIDIDTDIGP